MNSIYTHYISINSKLSSRFAYRCSWAPYSTPWSEVTSNRWTSRSVKGASICWRPAMRTGRRRCTMPCCTTSWTSSTTSWTGTPPCSTERTGWGYFGRNGLTIRVRDGVSRRKRKQITLDVICFLFRLVITTNYVGRNFFFSFGSIKFGKLSITSNILTYFDYSINVRMHPCSILSSF